ncbi:hypothetical protein V1478_017737 [Vespula squamosa]|uniref:C2H2-type domain-containing protein n=1 Tax=Vespula squamosa TaxID=30214 RepID=A0ABD1ZX47_VESSQ
MYSDRTDVEATRIQRMNSSQGPLIPNFIKIHSDGTAVIRVVLNIRSPQRNARTRYLGKMLQFLAVRGCSGLSITPGNYINYEDSKNGKTYYASTAFPPRLAPPLKRPRLMPPARSQHPKQQKQQPSNNTAAVPDLNQLKDIHVARVFIRGVILAGNPDILICGNCREMFTDLGELLEHKRNYCKLRFTCKCHTFNGAAPRDSTTALLCVLCKVSFPTAWELMVHAQAAHMINIYELGTRPQSPRSTQSPPQSPNQHAKESSPSPQDFQEIKATDCEERVEEEDLDGHELIPSPDSGKSTDNEAALSPIKIRSDVNGLDHEDCDELIQVENTAQACIMHALSITARTKLLKAVVLVAATAVAAATTTAAATAAVAATATRKHITNDRKPINVFLPSDSSLELNSDTNSRGSSGPVMALTNGSLSAKE